MNSENTKLFLKIKKIKLVQVLWIFYISDYDKITKMFLKSTKSKFLILGYLCLFKLYFFFVLSRILFYFTRMKTTY